MSCVMLAKMVRRRWRNFTYPRGGDIGPVRLESVESVYCVRASTGAPSQYQTEGLRVVGLPIDEVECIECIEKWRFGHVSGFDFDR
ncbi:hypothetical protein FIBSPDRAFT_28008 [Athelia psychrophila]|uniref:Uncharacterized protein n=1 Tax=Athelia psychrophila TaxID=1759441 RepID=A0A166G6J3_9AGAM|nr:hypothetical protein FIBSPDRAFT_28008 [Fibularhizoctonia sp. CBS 109695]